MNSSQNARQAAWMAVVDAYQLCSRRYDAMLARFGLTAPQFDALVAISRLGPRALPKNIASSMLVTRGNVTGILNRLRVHGLVSVENHSEDRRARVASLTDAGRQALLQAQTAARRFIEAQMAPFDDAEIDRTRRTMERMRTHLETLDPDAIAHGSPAGTHAETMA